VVLPHEALTALEIWIRNPVWLGQYRIKAIECQLKGRFAQSNVKVQGMGIFFFSMPYNARLYWVVSKWFIAP